MRYNGQTGSQSIRQEITMFSVSTKVSDHEIEKMIASLGGHAAIAEGIRWYGERCDLFDSRRRELTAKYPDQFVAMAADDTIIASETLDGLFDEIDRNGIEREPCVIEFLRAKPVVWII